MSTGTFRYLFGNRIAKFALSLATFCLLTTTKTVAQDFWLQTNRFYGGGIRTTNANGFTFAGTSGSVFHSLQSNTPFSTINFGETHCDAISSPSKVDTYTFVANAGDKVLVRMTAASGNLWPGIKVVGNGSILRQVYGTPTAEIDTLTLQAGGVYSVLCYDGFDGTRTGNYCVHVQRVNNPGNVIAANFGQTLSGSLNTVAEMDAYTFSANAGDKVLVRMTTTSGTLWSGIRVYSPAGKRLRATYGTPTAEIDTLTLPSAGRYTVLSYDGFDGTRTGTYALQVQRLNDPGNAKPMSFGQTLSDTLNSATESKTYTFTANAGDKILARMSVAAGTMWSGLRVYGPNGRKLRSTYGVPTAELDTLTLSTGGRYTVLAHDGFDGSRKGNFALHVQRVNNPGNAVSIDYGQLLSGTITKPAEMDAFTFAGEAGKKVLIRMTVASGTMWAGLRAYSPTGQKLRSVYSTPTAQIDTLTLPVSGRYTFLAYDGFDGTRSGNYNVTLICLTPPCPITTGNTISGRVNDNSGTAVAGATVTASGPITASTTTASDGTYVVSNLSNGTYSVTASKTGYTSPSAKSVTVPPNATNVDFVLQRTGNTPIMPIVSTPQLAGQEFWVEVKVGDNANPVTNLFGVSFCLTFTQTNFIDVVTPYSSNVITGPFLGSDVIFQYNVDEATGKVCIGVSRKTGQGGASGSGVVARVKFMSKANTPNGTQVQFCTTEVSANDPNGNPISLTPSCMTVTINSCLTVWSGDTNNDGKVDQADVLPLGLYWGRTGSACQTPPNCTWAARCCAPWTPAAITYVDANGDGVVNQADVLCLGLNWGKTHSTIIAKTNQQTEALRSEQNATIEPGVNPVQTPSQEFFLRIKISEVANLFGLSFELLYDQMPLLQILSVEPDSLLGSDVVFYSTVDTLNGKIAVGISRKAGQSGSNGTGSVVRVRAKISGKANNGTKISFALQNVVANDANGAPLDLTLRSASTTVLRTAVASEREMALPAEHWLGQNYPNPFNPSTAIAFSLPRAGHVTLKVYDILGKEIATLVDQHLSIGRHEAIWDAGSVESGVYFYQLRAGEFVATKKLILMK